MRNESFVSDDVVLQIRVERESHVAAHETVSGGRNEGTRHCQIKEWCIYPRRQKVSQKSRREMHCLQIGNKFTWRSCNWIRIKHVGNNRRALGRRMVEKFLRGAKRNNELLIKVLERHIFNLAEIAHSNLQ